MQRVSLQRAACYGCRRRGAVICGGGETLALDVFVGAAPDFPADFELVLLSEDGAGHPSSPQNEHTGGIQVMIVGQRIQPGRAQWSLREDYQQSPNPPLGGGGLGIARQIWLHTKLFRAPVTEALQKWDQRLARDAKRISDFGW